MSRPVGWATALAAVALIAGAAGYYLGSAGSAVFTESGTVHVGEGQASIAGDDGWTYSVPSDVVWTDSSGTWHQGGTPACFPAVGRTGRATFDAIQVTVAGTTWRPVVWVSCR